MTVEPITKPRKVANDYTPQHASLYEALRAAQESLPEVAKNRTAKVKGRSKNGNEFEYSYKYADITDVLSAVRPHFAKHGLTILQPTRIDGNALQVATRIVHDVTGQFEESIYPVAAIGADHQALGSALTYARRYALCSMIGLAPDEDTDGQTAAASGSPQSDRRRSNVVTNPATGKKIDTENARNQRPEWDRFTDTVQGFIDARDDDGLRAWYTSDKTAKYVAGWVYRDQAEEHFEKAIDEIAARERA
jgi:hypothetical protein